MIQECIGIFEKNLKKYHDNYILDNYIPKDGTYIFILMKEDIWSVQEPLTIHFDKKTGQLEGKDSPRYPLLRYMDYYSKLIEINKPVDSKKMIHSNNYLTFFIKKENLLDKKLTQEICDRYYDVLKNPALKYHKSKKTLILYQKSEEKLGTVNEEELESIREWVEENILKNLNLDINIEEKDYLKLFFIYPDEEKTKAAYQREGERYIFPNIYNNNEYNVVVDGQIMGIPNNNLNMNSKKPYLSHHSRKMQVPYLLSQKDALLQAKFYDFLMGYVSQKKVNIYFDNEAETIQGFQSSKHPPSRLRGYFLRIQKGKNEAKIQHADTVINYNPNLHPAFDYQAILPVESQEGYGKINQRDILEKKIDEIFFNKGLISNYFVNPEEIAIQDGTVLNQMLAVRQRLFTWFHLENGMSVLPLFQKTGSILIKNSVSRGYWKKAKNQINLLWSLEDYLNGNKRKEEHMNQITKQLWNHMNQKEEWEFSSDQEYFFAVGQLVSYFLNQSKSKKKPLSFVNQFINAKDDKVIKKHLLILFKKYNYNIDGRNIRVNRLYSNVMLYKPEMQSVDTIVISAGVTAQNLIFIKAKNEKDANDEEMNYSENFIAE